MKWLLTLYYIIRNSIDFPLRRLIKWRRKGLEFHNEHKGDIFKSCGKTTRINCEAEETRLRTTFNLIDLFKSSSVDNYFENLYYLQMLETGLDGVSLPGPIAIDVLDTGPSHWFYIQALAAYLEMNLDSSQHVLIDGYEIDPYRIYSDYYSRYDHAVAHIRDKKNINYFPNAYEPGKKKYDLVISFFPFIFLLDHLKWGLPLWNFSPGNLLEKQLSSLKPGGYLLIANQGENEHLEQINLLKDAGITPLRKTEFSSPFYQYQYKRFLTLVKHNG